MIERVFSLCLLAFVVTFTSGVAPAQNRVVARSTTLPAVAPTSGRVSSMIDVASVNNREITWPKRGDEREEETHRELVFPGTPWEDGRPGSRIWKRTGTPSPSPAATFPGTEFSASGRIPPDAVGAAGTRHVMLSHNGVVQIRDKATGELLKQTSQFEFWRPARYPNQPDVWTFDPRILFDATAAGGGRWIISAAADRTSLISSIVLAVSATPDPLGAWHYYRFDPPGDSTSLWYDYPILGVGAQWIVVRAAFPDFDKHTYVIPKAAAFAGEPVEPLRLEDELGVLAPTAALDGSVATQFLVGTGTDVYALRGPVDGPVTLEHLAHVTPPPGTSSWANTAGNLFGQLGTSVRIAGGTSAANTAIVRNGSIWYAHTVFLPAVSSTRAAAQWWEIDAATLQVAQFGRVEDPAEGPERVSYAFPAIAVNAAGDAVLGYSIFSPSHYASAGYSLRAVSDPPGTMRDPVLLRSGLGPYRLSDGVDVRWGDYSGASADPSSDDLWVFLEYSATTTNHAWGTWCGRVRLAPDTALGIERKGAHARASDSDLLSPTSAFTIEALVKPDRIAAKGRMVLLSKRGGAGDAGGYELRLEPGTGKLTFALYDSTGREIASVTSEAAVSAGQWSHVAGSFDGTALFAGVNGAVISSPAPRGATDGRAALVLGAGSSGKGAFRGALDGARLSSVARYTAAYTPPEYIANDSATLGLWTFDATAGLDASGNGNTVTLTSQARLVPGAQARR